ncbi:OmpA family protein [Nocardiopsis sp. LOL_012]|uniref:OmpA family protein n=1 Tax=Nocardiopsis sp. LOL_012 TaxID=3345409 RepID=UPI003A8639B3
MAFILALSGCSSLIPDEPDPCDHGSASLSAEGVTAERVVMVDRSSSLWQREDGMPDLRQVLADLIIDEELYGKSERRLVTLGLFDGTGGRSSATTWELPGTDVVEDRVDDEREAFADCVRDVYLTDALSDGPVAEGTDVLGGIAGGEARFVTGREAEGVLRHLVVVTDGLANGGCLDLTELADEWAEAPEAAAEAVDLCRDSNEWPEGDLAGTEVDIHLMMAYSEDGDRRSDVWLTEFWREVCEASAAECAVGQPVGTHDAETMDGPAPEFTQDAPVHVPEWEEPCEIQELPGDLLFPHDSATAHPEALALLDELAERNRDCAGTVTVTGHTDSQGGDTYNDRLSLSRAEYVADHLADHGFSDVTAVGRGERDLACPGDYTDNDDVDHPCPTANRRVVVEFSSEEA